MKDTVKRIYEDLFVRYPQLNCIREQTLQAYDVLFTCLQNGGTVYCCGNGGSAADSEHIVGEMMKSFRKKRAIDKKQRLSLSEYGADGKYLASVLEGSLPALSLNSHEGIITAFANDNSWEAAYAQQLFGLAKKEDCLIVLSTSGNSKNCIYASIVAKSKGMGVIAFAGGTGGNLKAVCDVALCMPETETYKVQELHLPVYHCLCAMLEEEFF